MESRRLEVKETAMDPQKRPLLKEKKSKITGTSTPFRQGEEGESLTVTVPVVRPGATFGEKKRVATLKNAALRLIGKGGMERARGGAHVRVYGDLDDPCRSRELSRRRRGEKGVRSSRRGKNGDGGKGMMPSFSKNTGSQS